MGHARELSSFEARRKCCSYLRMTAAKKPRPAGEPGEAFVRAPLRLSGQFVQA